MRRSAAVLWIVGLSVAASSPPPAAAELRAGAASRTIELPAGVPLAGYSKRGGKPSRGVHDPVGVRAVVLQDGDVTLALVSGELLIIDEHLYAEARRRITRRGSLPAEAVLLIAATHTHSGPGAYGGRFLEKISMGHFDYPVFNAIAQAMVDAVSEAADRLGPVRIASGAVATQGLVRNRVRDDGPVQDALTVAALHGAGQAPVAVLMSFAAHPTVLGAGNMQVSGDYPGAAVRALEAAFPGTVALFFAGAVADQGPGGSGEGFERAEAMGKELARLAAEWIRSAQPAPAGPLRAAEEVMRLPAAKVRLGRLTLPRWMGGSLVDEDASLVAARLDGVAVFGAPCDLAADLGRRLEAAAHSKGLRPLVIGFANDYIGYCIPESLYHEQEYESSMAFNGPRAGALVTERLIGLMEGLGD